MKAILLYLLKIFINGALVLASLFVGSKAWHIFTHASGIFDFLKYLGLLVVYFVLITILVRKK
jgi:hypothetical protein